MFPTREKATSWAREGRKTRAGDFRLGEHGNPRLDYLTIVICVIVLSRRMSRPRARSGGEAIGFRPGATGAGRIKPNGPSVWPLSCPKTQAFLCRTAAPARPIVVFTTIARSIKRYPWA